MPPRLNERLRRMLTFHCDAPRSLLRPTPAGRSLNTVSPLSSVPVVSVYGGADENCACSAGPQAERQRRVGHQEHAVADVHRRGAPVGVRIEAVRRQRERRIGVAARVRELVGHVAHDPAAGHAHHHPDADAIRRPPARRSDLGDVARRRVRTHAVDRRVDVDRAQGVGRRASSCSRCGTCPTARTAARSRSTPGESSAASAAARVESGWRPAPCRRRCRRRDTTGSTMTSSICCVPSTRTVCS